MYRKAALLISFALVLGFLSKTASAVDPNLVGRWTFDDGTANDSSGNEHHGTLKQGDATTSISIVYDAVRDSNVLNCSNPAGHTTCSVVDCGTGSWANISDAITIAAWTKPRTIEQTNYLLSKHSRYQFTAVPEGQARFYLWNHSDDRTTFSKSSLLDGKWHHVAFTYDFDTKSRRVYFDGDLEEEEFPDAQITRTTWTLVIGGRLHTNFDHKGWDGLIDDVRLYDKAISYEEVRELAENYKAYDPVPSNGEQDVSPTLASLGWKAGIKAAAKAGHKVYFGTSRALVEANDASVSKGTVDSNVYSGAAMGSLSAAVDYYWKVDAVNGANKWPGDVWTFRTSKSESK